MRCLHTGKLPTKLLRDASLKRKDFVACPTCGRICRPGPNGNLPSHNPPRDHRELRINLERAPAPELRSRLLNNRVSSTANPSRPDSPTLANYLKSLGERC